jgi:hypothetical protein
VTDFVGPGEHIFLSTVSKSFRACYLNVADFKGVYEGPDGEDIYVTVVHHMTIYSSILGSRSRVRLAVELGFVLDPKSWWCQFNAGQCADIETLKQLHEQYHMPYIEVVSRAAAQSGTVRKMQWLLDEQHCPLAANICTHDMYAPTLDMLKYLEQRGCTLPEDLCDTAARSRNAASILQYLHSEGVPFRANTMVEALEHQELTLLQWLYERGCPLSEAAAMAAKDLEDLSVLNWLYSKDCPCDYEELCFEAVLNGYIDILQWARDNAVVHWSPAALTVYLNYAGSQGCLDTAQVCEHFLYPDVSLLKLICVCKAHRRRCVLHLCACTVFTALQLHVDGTLYEWRLLVLAFTTTLYVSVPAESTWASLMVHHCTLCFPYDTTCCSG